MGEGRRRGILSAGALTAVVVAVVVAVQVGRSPDPERPRPATGADTKVADWETVTDDEGGFVVELPAPARRGQARARIAPDVTVDITSHLGGGMSVTWFTYPESFPKASSPQAELEERVAAIYTDVRGVAVSVTSQPAKVGGLEGAFLRVQADRSQTRAYAVVSGSRLYLLDATVNEQWHPKDEERMVNSFRLVPSS